MCTSNYRKKETVNNVFNNKNMNSITSLFSQNDLHKMYNWGLRTSTVELGGSWTGKQR